MVVFIFGVWLATEKHAPVSKKEVNGIELNTVIVDNVEHKIERAYSTAKALHMETIDGQLIVLVEYKINKEGKVTEIK